MGKELLDLQLGAIRRGVRCKEGCRFASRVWLVLLPDGDTERGRRGEAPILTTSSIRGIESLTNQEAG